MDFLASFALEKRGAPGRIPCLTCAVHVVLSTELLVLAYLIGADSYTKL